MIGIEISGGLGNQFFRYAWGRTLLERRRAEGLADTVAINYNGVDGHGFAGSLRDFHIVEHEAPTCQRLLLRYGSLPQKAAFAAFKLLGRVCRGDGFQDFRRRTLARMGVLVSESPDSELLITPPLKISNVFVWGSFEHVRYFEGMRSVLCREFTPRHAPLPENAALYEAIAKGNSVCLAVRRGDFMTAENRKTFYVCDLAYFQRAVDYMQAHVERPVFIVFSNDIEWVKANLKIRGEVHYESGHDPVWETFRLMSSCRHFIISNSTLHWWAQWKGEAKDKIVVAPDRWYNAEGWTEHLMLPSFVRIATGVAYKTKNDAQPIIK